MIIENTVLVVARKEVAASKLGDGLALLDMGTAKYFNLNSVGAFAWSLLDAPVSLSAIEGAIVEKFDVSHTRCAEDLQTLFSALLDAKLVEIVE